MKRKRENFIAMLLVCGMLLCGCGTATTRSGTNSAGTTVQADALPSDDMLVNRTLYLFDMYVLPVSWWRGAGSDSLCVNEFAEPLENTPEGTTFHPVTRFQSIDAMKRATEQVFTKAYAEENLYPFLEKRKQFLERDGKLYMNTSAGAGMPPWGPVAADVKTKSVNSAILSVTFQDPYLEEEIHDIGLKLEDGIWKLNDYPYL